MMFKRLFKRIALNREIRALEKQYEPLLRDSCAKDYELLQRMYADITKLKQERDALRSTTTT